MRTASALSRISLTSSTLRASARARFAVSYRTSSIRQPLLVLDSSDSERHRAAPASIHSGSASDSAVPAHQQWLDMHPFVRPSKLALCVADSAAITEPPG